MTIMVARYGALGDNHATYRGAASDAINADSEE